LLIFNITSVLSVAYEFFFIPFVLFCSILPNAIALQADYVTVIEYRAIMSARYRLPVTIGQN